MKRRRCKTCKHLMKGHKKKRCNPEETIKMSDGSKYIGTIYNGQPSGRGRLTSEDLTYEGEFLAGKKHGEGIQTEMNGTLYKGSWCNNLYHGYGELKSKNSIYIGQFHTGTFHGTGTIEKNTGIKYSGEWCHGVYHGEGDLTTPEGHFCGQFCYGLRHGKGKNKDAFGNIFNGQWKQGLRDGFGVYTTEDSVYSGKWCKGFRSGYGELRSKRHGIYTGLWKNDKKHNKGQQIYTNGTKYDGGWSRGLKTGFGVQEWSDGAIYEGFWLKDNYNGRGVLKLPNKNSFSGEWKHGARVGHFIESRHDGTISEGPWINDLRHGTFTEVKNDKKVELLYIWGDHIIFKTKKEAKHAVIRSLRKYDFRTAEVILRFYPSLLKWNLLFSYDIEGQMIYLLETSLIKKFIKKYSWTLFQKKRYMFIENLIKHCPSNIMERIYENVKELFDSITGIFVANPWIANNMSYSKNTRKRLLEGLHLGELGRCPPKDPFTRQPLTKKSGIFLKKDKKKSKKIYKTLSEAVDKEPTIQNLAYTFDLEDFEISLKNARDVKDIKTIRKLMEQRSIFIQSKQSYGAEDNS